MSRGDMAEFWDARAGENPYWFIWNNLDYASPDQIAFWASGEADLDAVLGRVGAELPADADVLELGCGIGRMTRALAARVGQVRALDVSPRMLELAREHNPELTNVDWIQGDGTSLAVIDADSIDRVFSHVVLQHIPDAAVICSYIREFGRVLRPGGEAIFGVSTDAAVHTRRRPALLRRVQGRVRVALNRAPSGQDAPQWLGTAISIEAAERALADGGMRTLAVDGAGTQFCYIRASRD